MQILQRKYSYMPFGRIKHLPRPVGWVITRPQHLNWPYEFRRNGTFHPLYMFSLNTEKKNLATKVSPLQFDQLGRSKREIFVQEDPWDIILLTSLYISPQKLLIWLLGTRLPLPWVGSSSFSKPSLDPEAGRGW